MFLPFIGAQAPIEQKTLTLIQKPVVVKAEPPPLTLEQKIKTNFYKCNTDIQWIRADNAQCLDKQQQTQVTSQKALKQPVRSSGGNNGYDFHSCTWWVKYWKPSVGDNWGNANNWGYAAQAEGWTVSSVPVVGAVAWSTAGYYGHVALVIGVNGSEVTIRSGNYDFNGDVAIQTVSASTYRYIY